MADGSTNLAPGHGGADAVHREELLQLAPHLRPVADRPRGWRESLEHRGPIVLGDDPPVQQDDRPDVRLGADQPSESLFQLERRKRNEIVGEAVDTRFGETLQPRSARPGTSTPSQNESVPSRIAEPASRKRRSS